MIFLSLGSHGSSCHIKIITLRVFVTQRKLHVHWKPAQKQTNRQNIWTLPSLPIPPNRRSTLSLSLRIMQPGGKGCHVSDVLIKFDSWGLTKWHSYLNCLWNSPKTAKKHMTCNLPETEMQRHNGCCLCPSTGSREVSVPNFKINCGWGSIISKSNNKHHKTQDRNSMMLLYRSRCPATFGPMCYW